jgi:hypothetical protein
MNTFAVDFLNAQNARPKVATEFDRDRFVESLRSMIAEGHYPAYSANKNLFFPSNKDPQKLAKLVNGFDDLIAKTFEKM